MNRNDPPHIRDEGKSGSQYYCNVVTFFYIISTRYYWTSLVVMRIDQGLPHVECTLYHWPAFSVHLLVGQMLYLSHCQCQGNYTGLLHPSNEANKHWFYSFLEGRVLAHSESSTHWWFVCGKYKCFMWCYFLEMAALCPCFLCDSLTGDPAITVHNY